MPSPSGSSRTWDDQTAPTLAYRKSRIGPLTVALQSRTLIGTDVLSVRTWISLSRVTSQVNDGNG